MGQVECPLAEDGRLADGSVVAVRENEERSGRRRFCQQKLLVRIFALRLRLGLGLGLGLGFGMSMFSACGPSGAMSSHEVEPGAGQQGRVRAEPRVPTPEEVLVGAEFARAAGIDRLLELSKSGPLGLRGRALRGLGRSAGPSARTSVHLQRALEAEGDRVAAARAYGLLGERASAEPLIRALEGADPELTRAIFDALSRVAVADDRSVLLPLLATGLGADDPQVAAAAGLALGRLGRRRIELDLGSESAAVLASGRPSGVVRYAATYALARGASLTPEVLVALRGRLQDEDPEVRALAIVGLARRFVPVDPVATTGVSKQGKKDSKRGVQEQEKDQEQGRQADVLLLAEALADPSWLVVIEAVRALTAAQVPPIGRQALIDRLRRALLAIAGDSPGTELQIIEIGLDRLGPFAGEASVAVFAKEAAAESLAHLRSDSLRSVESQLAFSRIHCRALALAIRGGAPATEMTACGGPVSRGSAIYLRRAIWAELAGSGFAGGFETLSELAVHRDARVRLAAVLALGERGRSPLGEREKVVERLMKALGDRSTAVAGTSAEILGSLAKTRVLRGADREQVLLALLNMSQKTGNRKNPEDPEFETALLGALAAVVGPRPADLELAQVAAEEPLPGDLLARVGERCRPARHALLPLPVRRAALACLEALPEELRGRADELPEEGREAGRPSPLAIDPRSLLGASVIWTLDTTKGVITIRLDPEAAPWNVAALVELSRRAYYSDVAWHRVVPGFVTQGGDPTGTGWGGPGFSSPGEASWSAFRRGAVGIADAGLDTGGSQFFIMHRRAAHLEGRYTWVGEVIQGQEVVDRLTTDDRILSAMVDTRRAGRAPAGFQGEGRGVRN